VPKTLQGDHVQPSDLLDRLSTVAALPASGGEADAALSSITSMAVATVAACDGASVSFAGVTGVTTRAATSGVVEALDDLQYQTGQGPCLEAIATGAICQARDSTATARWPAFWSAARAHDLCGVVSLPLRVEDRVAGSLNLYEWTAQGRVEADDRLSSVLAAVAALTLATEDALRRHAELVEQLNQALESRDVIGQAKGILMARESCTSEAAFDMLRRASQRLNQKLRDVAEQIAASTTSGPPGGPARRRGG
jgi:hypothetical protein